VLFLWGLFPNVGMRFRCKPRGGLTGAFPIFRINGVALGEPVATLTLAVLILAAWTLAAARIARTDADQSPAAVLPPGSGIRSGVQRSSKYPRMNMTITTAPTIQMIWFIFQFS